MAEGGAARPPAGLLEQPPSWLRQLIISLPERDRKALFQTCMQLAMQVLASAPYVALRMVPHAHASPITIKKSRPIIAQLLASRTSFALVVQARGPQPFPVELSSKVTEVRLEYREAGPVSSWLDWSAFASLQSLHLNTHTTQTDLNPLCGALEAGHLAPLRHLRWSVWSVWTDDSVDYECLARAFGSRITSLSVHGSELLQYSKHLTALHSVEWVMGGGVQLHSAQELMPLLEHPNLQEVKLVRCKNISGDLSRHSCKWRSLHLIEYWCPEVLLRLPIANLQELHIHTRICVVEDADLQAVRFLVDNLLDRVHLVPDWNHTQRRLCFEVTRFTAETVPLVSRLNSDCWLIVKGDDYAREQCPAFLPALWTSVPSSVSGLRLDKLHNVSWSHFWDGIPASIQHLELHSYDMCPGDEGWDTSVPHLTLKGMCNLVASTPEHVCSLNLLWLYSVLWDSYVAVNLKKFAPQHLQLKLTPADKMS